MIFLSGLFSSYFRAATARRPLYCILPESVGHAHHLLLVLGVLHVRVRQVDDGALHGVALVAVDEHVRPAHHLHSRSIYLHDVMNNLEQIAHQY